jgi:ADP-heptose:LPS heptosyltransferase
MLLPALKALKEALQNQSIKLFLSVQQDMFPIFQDNNHIDRLYPLPVPLADLRDMDYVADFSGSLKEALKWDLHLTDFFMQTLHLDPDHIPDKRGHISPKLSESPTIIELFNKLRIANPNHKIVLLNWRASTHIKSLPPYLLSEVTNQSKDKIFLVVHPESLTHQTDEALLKHGVRAINMSSHMKNLYDYFTAVALADEIICSDTSTYHIASLFDKPSLVITGPTYSVLTKYYPHCTALEAHYHGTHCTSPCGRVRGTCPEAQYLGTPFSPCLMSISPLDVVEIFKQRIERSSIGFN